MNHIVYGSERLGGYFKMCEGPHHTTAERPTEITGAPLCPLCIERKAIWDLRVRYGMQLREEAQYPTLGHVFRAEPVHLSEETLREIYRRAREAFPYPDEKDHGRNHGYGAPNWTKPREK